MTCPLIEYAEYKRWRQVYPEITRLNLEAPYERFLKIMGTRYYQKGMWQLTENEEKILEQRKT